MNLLGGLGSSVKKLELLITANTSNAVLGVSTLQARTQGLTKNMGGLAGAAGGAGSTLSKMAPYAIVAAKAIAAVGLSIGAVAVKSVSLGSQMAQVKQAFTTLLGSAKESDAFVKKMWQFAKNTPFEFQGVVQGARMLKAMGLETKKILPWITAVGDAVAAMGGSTEMTNRVVIAVGQMMNKQKVSMQEVRQLTEAGIPALDILAKHAGITKEKLSELVDAKKFKMSGREGAQAIIDGMNERFKGAMKGQMETVLGQWTTLVDNINGILMGIGGKLTEHLHLVEVMKSLNIVLGAMSDKLMDNKDGFASLIPKSIPSDLRNIWQAFKEGLEVSSIIKEVHSLMATLGQLFKKLNPDLKALWQESLPLLTALALAIGQVLKYTAILVLQLIRTLAPALGVVVNAFRFAINTVNLFVGIMSGDTKLMEKAFKNLGDSAKKIIEGMFNILLSLFGTNCAKIRKHMQDMNIASQLSMKAVGDRGEKERARLGTIFSGWATTVKTYAVTQIGKHLVNSVVLFGTFPGRVSKAISSLYERLAAWISSWGKMAKDHIYSFITDMVGYFRAMPSRIINAIKGFSLYDWGKNLIGSIWTGIKSGLTGGPSKEKSGDLESMAAAFFGKLGNVSVGSSKGWGLRPDVAGLAQMLSSMFGLKVTSGLRPGAMTSSGNKSLHASGRAVDLGGSAAAMRAAFMLATTLPGIKEAIFQHMIYKPGRGIGYWARNDHMTHVHVGKFHSGGVIGGIGDVPVIARAGEVIVTSAQFRKFTSAIDRLNQVLGRASYMQSRTDILQNSQNYADTMMKFFPAQMGRMATSGYAFGDAARETGVALRMAKVKNDVEGINSALSSIADLRTQFSSHIQEVFNTAQTAIEQWRSKAEKEINKALDVWSKYYQERIKQIDNERKASEKYYNEEFSKLDALAEALQASRSTTDTGTSRARETETDLRSLSEKKQQLSEIEAQQFLTVEDVDKRNQLIKEIYDAEQAIAQKQADWRLADQRAKEDAEIDAKRKELELQQDSANEQFTALEESLNAQNTLEQEKAQERLTALQEEASKRLSTIAENLYAINQAYDTNLNQIVTTEGSALSTSTQQWQAWNEAVLNAYRSVMSETGSALGNIGSIGGISTPNIGGLPGGLPGSSAAEGKPITWMVPGKTVNGTALVPVRELAAALGAQGVNWDAANARASFFANGQSVSFKVGLASVDIGNTHVGLPAAPFQSEGVMYVPARTVAERLGAKVLWEGGKVGIQFHKGGRVPFSGYHELLEDERVFTKKQTSIIDNFLATGKLPNASRNSNNGRVNVNHSFDKFVAEMRLIIDGDVSQMDKERIQEVVDPLIKKAKREIETKIIRDYESVSTYQV